MKIQTVCEYMRKNEAGEPCCGLDPSKFRCEYMSEDATDKGLYVDDCDVRVFAKNKGWTLPL